MKKNVIWWPAVVNPEHAAKYGGFEYFQQSRKTWEYWCKKNDVLFVPFEKPVKNDLIKYRVNWQKAIFVFDELDRMGIEYDQVALIDSTVMVKWDCPNFFNLTDRKFVVTKEMDNLKWVYDSVLGYKEFFNGFELDISKYFRSGFMIFNEKHREFFNDLKKLYLDNIEAFIKLQDEIVKKGNDQTPVNYLIQMNNIDLKFFPNNWVLSHMHRKEAFRYNWQMDNTEYEDKTPWFIKYGYTWMFNGIPKDQRTLLMKQTWDLVGHMYE